jgi:pyruvate dehydrogenase E2 component (dihydrolipoamide acetyltransferase)
MTDKASVEIPSPRNGVIAALLAEEGQMVNVGAAIIAIDVDGEAVSSAPAAGHAAAHAGASATATAAPPAATPASGAGAKVQATPAVRQLAKQLGVALETVAGSGPGGAITAQDVQRAAGGPAGAATASAPSASAKPGASPGTGATPAGPEERVPVRGLRRRIAEHMRHSIETAAHFTFVAECDWTEIVRHRASLKVRAEKAGVPLTYLAYVVRALVPTLREHPMLNASLDDEKGEIVLKRHYDVGVATHTAEGLTVPVVHGCDRRSLFDLAREIDRLAQAARNTKLKLEELHGATFTVTSTGARGGVLATPILHHPQVAILGVHEIKKKPAVVNDQIAIRELGNLSLSLDHRVVDGAVGAEFLYDLIRRLEHPAEWASDTEAA